MKVFSGSDLHLEFGMSTLQVPSGDVLILAGDVFIPWVSHAEVSKNRLQKYTKRFKRFFQWCSKNFKWVIFVPGNHEFYHGSIEGTIERIKDWFTEYPNIILLNNEVFQYEHVIFFGSTMWTDYNGGNPLVMMNIDLEDFNLISHRGNYSTPNDFYRLNQIARASLHEFVLETDFTGKLPVIVTHHAPTWGSIQGKYRVDSKSYAYANMGLENLIFQLPRSVWIHGHTHLDIQYEVGNCSVICNPRGYWRHERRANVYDFFELEL